MFTLPGWNSLEAVTRFQWVAEIAGIGLSILLVLASVMALLYGSRKDRLTDDIHNNEIAHLRLETAQATERAANANLEQEKIKAKVAWRTVTTDMAKQLLSVLSKARHNITIASISNDAESSYFADQLLKVFKTAGWQTYAETQTYNRAITGIFVPDPATTSTTIVRQALTTAGISFFTETLPEPGMTMGYGASTEATVIIGSKPQLF